jgi:hypothetical protein
MIAENSAHLVSLIQGIAVLSKSTGLAAGGRTPDPGLLKIPLPAAWVLYAGDKPNEPQTGFNASNQVLTANYVVMIYIPYISAADLEANQYPMIEAVIQAIRGQQAPKGQRWRYEGQKLSVVNPDRLAYEQRYSVVVSV